MTESTDSGWLFEEALAKTSDPRLWDRYQAEKRQHTPTLADLRRSLIAELLAKIGTKLFAATPRAMKSDGGWAMLDRAALEKRIANPNERIDQIRLFAPLQTPNAIEQLKDRGLGDAFKQFVLEDPEVTVLLQRMGTPDRFEGGRSPCWYIDYHWQLETTANDLAARLDRTGIINTDDLMRPPTPEALALCVVLADRITAFRNFLVSGRIQAFGLSAHFVEAFVPARQWARQNLSIDVANGDLCEEDNGGKFSPMWTGVELRFEEREPIRCAEPVQKAAAPTRKRRAKGQEVERIIKEKGIDVGQSGPKAAASEVMKYMKKPPEFANEVKALEVLVRRISGAGNQTL